MKFNFQLGEMRFGQRERLWALILILVAIGTSGNKVLIQPRIEAKQKARLAWSKADNALGVLEAQKPDLTAQRTRIQELQSEVGATFQNLERLEKGLLYQQDQDLLLERLVANRKKLGLKINLVEPIREKQKKSLKNKKKNLTPSFYKRLLVKVDIFAGFDNLINYLVALEEQGPYQRVRAVKIRMEKKERTVPRAVVMVEVLLADSGIRKVELRSKVQALVKADDPATMGKDPFMPSEKPKEELEAVGMELAGIFGVSGEWTALIDGNPYRVGDVIQGKQIVQILPNRVILEAGDKRYVLNER